MSVLQTEDKPTKIYFRWFNILIRILCMKINLRRRGFKIPRERQETNRTKIARMLNGRTVFYLKKIHKFDIIKRIRI